MNVAVRPSDPYKINGLVFEGECDPSAGHVRWDTARSLWNGGMLLAALILGPIYFTWSALAVFLALCFVTLCFGHSVGFHRRLIHRSFQCPKWLERILIYLGTVVGMGGPLWTIRTHDMRDWAQRSPNCHPFFAHKAPIWKDGFWYLHCKLVLDKPPGSIRAPSFATTASISSSTTPRCSSRFRSRWCCLRLAECRGSSGASSCASPPARRCTGTFHGSRTRAVRSPGWSMAWARWVTTCRCSQFRRWAKAGTTIITHSRRPRGTACFPDNSIRASGSSGCSNRWGLRGTSRHRKRCRRVKASAR